MAEKRAAEAEPGKEQAQQEGSGRRGIRGILARFLTGTGPILAAWLLLCVVLAFIAPNFLEFDNFTQIVVQSAVIGIAAVGMTFVIITAGAGAN